MIEIEMGGKRWEEVGEEGAGEGRHGFRQRLPHRLPFSSSSPFLVFMYEVQFLALAMAGFLPYWQRAGKFQPLVVWVSSVWSESLGCFWGVK